MGFWRSLANFIDRQIEADRERQAVRREREEYLAGIREEGRAYEEGRLEARQMERESRCRSRRVPKPWPDIRIPTEEEAARVWLGEPKPKRKKKNRSNNIFF